MAIPIEIVEGKVIATPDHLLDFVAVATWKKGLLYLNCMSVGKQGISAKDTFSLWVGLTAHMVERNPPPQIEKILVTALQSLNPEFTYLSKIDGE